MDDTQEVHDTGPEDGPIVAAKPPKRVKEVSPPPGALVREAPAEAPTTAKPGVITVNGFEVTTF